MRTPCFLLVLVVALGACKKDPPPPPPEENWLAEARQALMQRDLTLASFHVVADTKEAGVAAHHEFYFRAPNHMRGTVTRPTPQTLAFDGARFYRLDPTAKTLEIDELKLSPGRGAMFLAQNFTPFVPEGYRTPLMPMQGVTAKKVLHPRGPEAWALSFTAIGEQEQPIEVTFFLRVPTADFLGKQVASSLSTDELVVADEYCDPRLNLCVPKKVVHQTDGTQVATADFSAIELNLELPQDSFTVTAPAGYAVSQKTLVDSGP